MPLINQNYSMLALTPLKVYCRLNSYAKWWLTCQDWNLLIIIRTTWFLKLLQLNGRNFEWQNDNKFWWVSHTYFQNGSLKSVKSSAFRRDGGRRLTQLVVFSFLLKELPQLIVDGFQVFLGSQNRSCFKQQSWKARWVILLMKEQYLLN